MSKEHLKEDPLDLFKEWLQAAVESEEKEPNAMVLSTSTAKSITSRTVLLKEVRPEGLLFFTNIESLKAQQIQEHPQVSLLFLWLNLSRQVMIQGQAERLPQEEVEAYFRSRPRGAQLGAWASRQDQVIPDRETLSQAFEEVSLRFEGAEVPPPPWWGGYLVRPLEWSFWQGRRNRLHDRFSYTQEGSKWKTERLMP